MKRREFIKLNVGAAMLAGLPLSGLASQLGNKGDRIYTLIVDEHNRDCMHFLSTVNTDGVDIETVSGDLSKLWFDNLWPQIESQATWFAGMTTQNTALTLETVTRDYGHSFVSLEKLYAHTDKTIDDLVNNTSRKPRSEIMDALLTEQSNEAVFWVMGPSTINFKGKAWV